MYVSQLLMATLPNIELVSFLIIMATQKFGLKALCSVYLFVFCEIATYGISVWNIPYLYVWAIFVIIIFIIRKIDNAIVFSLVSGIYGLLFGILCSVPSFVTGGFGYGISWIISGIPYDILHAIGNVILTILLYKPIKKVFDRAI